MNKNKRTWRRSWHEGHEKIEKIETLIYSALKLKRIKWRRNWLEEGQMTWSRVQWHEGYENERQ